MFHVFKCHLEGVQKKVDKHHTVKMIDPRVKSQARAENKGSRALK